MIKDEHRYLEEWIEYHLKKGITSIYLFEDFGSKSHKEITDNYPKVTLKTFSESISPSNLKRIYDGEFPQVIIWETVYKSPEFIEKFDWMVFLDVDEFLEDNANDIISRHPNALSIEIPWQLMTSEDVFTEPPYKYSVVEYYKKTLSTKLANLNWCKCFVNLKHPLIQKGKISETVHCPHNFSKIDLETDDSRIYHYMFKTWPEYVSRLTEKGEMVNSGWVRSFPLFFYAQPWLMGLRRKYISAIPVNVKKNGLTRNKAIKEYLDGLQN